MRVLNWIRKKLSSKKLDAATNTAQSENVSLATVSMPNQSVKTEDKETAPEKSMRDQSTSLDQLQKPKQEIPCTSKNITSWCYKRLVHDFVFNEIKDHKIPSFNAL